MPPMPPSKPMPKAKLLPLFCVVSCLTGCSSNPSTGTDLRGGSPDGPGAGDLLGNHDLALLSPDLLVPERRFDWVQIVGTGQSLSVGVEGTPVLSTNQPYSNLKLLDSGPDPKYPLNGGGNLSLVPLVEPIRPALTGYADNQYPNNIFGETPHTAMANQISAISQALAGRDYVSLHTVVGWSGHSIVDIDKEGDMGTVGRAYPGTLSETRTFKTFAAAANKTFAVGAIILTHGEADTGDAMYEAQVYQLFQDYNNDLKQITGQTYDIPILLSQQSTLPAAQMPSESTQAEWRLGVDHPGQVICVGPKYQYFYGADHLHLDAANYIRLGEKYAEVYYQAVVRALPWKPLQPTAATVSGSVITVAMDVPVPPLNWDEDISPPHQTVFTQWKNGRGFEVSDNTGPLTISSVAIVGDSVQITLSAPPGAGLSVSYAMTQDATTGYQGNTGMGRRGQLRDSDSFVGIDAETIACAVQNGSTSVSCPGMAALQYRSQYDVVSQKGGTGVAQGTIVAAIGDANDLTLSRPFSGPSGMTELSFSHDQKNYLVQFTLAVP